MARGSGLRKTVSVGPPAGQTSVPTAMGGVLLYWRMPYNAGAACQSANAPTATSTATTRQPHPDFRCMAAV